MAKPRRNDRCPCGSGKKYKACCRAVGDLPVDLLAQNTPVQSRMVPNHERELFRELSHYFVFGYFDGVVQVASKLLGCRSLLRMAVVRYLFVSLSYSDTHDLLRTMRGLGVRDDEIGSVIEWLSRHDGMQGVSEILWTRTQCQEFAEFVHPPEGLDLSSLPSFMQKNPDGFLSFFHPSCWLKLGERALWEEDFSTAAFIVNIVIGCPNPILMATDLRRLHRLLFSLRAPKMLFAEWAFRFVERMQVLKLADHLNHQTSTTDNFAKFIQEQISDSSRTLSRALEHGPVELAMLTADLQTLFDVKSFQMNDCVIDTSRNDLQQCDSDNTINWLSFQSRSHRYPWLGLGSKRSDELAHNGDWAMMHCPTSDFSIAVAQWWRLLESELTHFLQVELGCLFDKHPEWLRQDRERYESADVSRKQKDRMKVFLNYADPSLREKFSLRDQLLLLEKCFSHREVDRTFSRLRYEASHHLQPFSRSFGSLGNRDEQGRYYLPKLLTEETIQRFRNRSSHDQKIGEKEALLGRTIVTTFIREIYKEKLQFDLKYPLADILSGIDVDLDEES